MNKGTFHKDSPEDVLLDSEQLRCGVAFEVELFTVGGHECDYEPFLAW